MIAYVVETELKDFDFWAGAVQVADTINALENSDEIWDLLDDYITTDSEPWSETEINDFIWFSALDILEENGYIENE